MSTEKSTQVTVNIDSSAEEREKLEAIQKVIDIFIRRSFSLFRESVSANASADTFSS